MKTLTIPFNDGLGVRTRLDCLPWKKEYPYLPYTAVTVSVWEEALRFSFLCDETPLCLSAVSYNEPVFRDSCVECFIMPFPEKDRRYLNFECSAAGVLYLGIGTERYDRRFLPQYGPEDFKVFANADRFLPWTVSFQLPFRVVREVYGITPQRGAHMRVNFQKCGNRGELDHYAVWNPIAVPEPDFHRPEFFGRLILGV